MSYEKFCTYLKPVYDLSLITDFISNYVSLSDQKYALAQFQEKARAVKWDLLDFHSILLGKTYENNTNIIYFINIVSINQISGKQISDLFFPISCTLGHIWYSKSRVYVKCHSLNDVGWNSLGTV